MLPINAMRMRAVGLLLAQCLCCTSAWSSALLGRRQVLKALPLVAVAEPASAQDASPSLEAKLALARAGLASAADVEDLKRVRQERSMRQRSAAARVQRYGSAALVYCGAMQLMLPRQSHVGRPSLHRMSLAAEGGGADPTGEGAGGEAGGGTGIPTDESAAAAPAANSDADALQGGPPDGGPTLPVSSTADKLKGFAAILLVLIGAGWTLNYSFSPDSPLLASDEPKVNQAMVKYATPLKAVSGDE